MRNNVHQMRLIGSSSPDAHKGRHYMYMLVLLLMLLLAGCGGSGASPSNGGSNSGSIANSQATTTPMIMATGRFQEYPLPQTNSQLMRPAIDGHGRIWFGEMGQNYLGVFDPHTQTFQQVHPPQGRSGIMGVVAAPDDSIWFAEQYANYIGHYLPATGKFVIYTLPRLTIPDPNNPGKTLSLPSAPNDLALDNHGYLWFTELNADSLGRLNTSTGIISQYPLSAKKSVQTLDPYGVTVDPHGMIWFTEASNDHVGRLDPTTGQIRYFTMPGLHAELMEIASDGHGTIWITSFTSGLLLSLDADTGKFTPYYAPFSGNLAGAIYGLMISPTDEVWITVSAEDALARLDLGARRFIYYYIPTHGSLPLGLVPGANSTIWFTEAGTDSIGMLQP